MSRTRVTVPLRWSDVDAYGHLNNARALSLLEEARVMAFWRRGDDHLRHHLRHAGGEAFGENRIPDELRFEGGLNASSNTLIVRQEIEYSLPIEYRPGWAVSIDLWICALGGASLDVGYEVFDQAGRPAILATTTIVVVDAKTGRPRRLTDEERAGWEQWMDAPPRMRRRA